MLSLLLCLVGAPFPVSIAETDQSLPVPAFANGQYYVFWEDHRFLSEDTTYAVFGARVSPQGMVLDPDGKLLYRWQARYDLSVATDGSELLVAFEDSC